MVDILHRIGVIAPLDDVYQAVATPEGMARWWTIDSVGERQVGGKLAFRFGDVGGFDMEILELDPAGRIRWRVIDGPEEWIGTEICWKFEQSDDYTIVKFKHQGWREPVDFMHHCTTKWAMFLMSLKEMIETGTGRPAPDDVQISDWH